MAFIPAANVIRVAMEFTKNGSLVVNVYHVRSNVPVASVNLTEVANLFVTWWSSNLRQQQTNQISLQRVVCTDLTVANGLQVTQTVSPPAPGTLAGADTPNNVALCITGLTGFSGRSFRGRTYLAGLVASEVESDFIIQGRATAILAAFLVQRGVLIAQGYQWGVLSTRANKTPRPEGLFTPYTSFRLNLRVDTQRRRLSGSGA